MGYDAHLFIRSLGFSEGEIKCIPNNDEKYISFSKYISFPDSLAGLLDKDQFKILEAGLGTNEILKKKGVYPYEYMTDFEKLAETELPSREVFYSKLHGEGISEVSYEHAKRVWEEMGCKSMRDYHDLYPISYPEHLF